MFSRHVFIFNHFYSINLSFLFLDANKKTCRNSFLIALAIIGLIWSLIFFVMTIAGNQKTLENLRKQPLIPSNMTDGKLCDASEQFNYDLLKKTMLSSVGIIVFGIFLVGIAIKNTRLVTTSYYLSFVMAGAMVNSI